MNYEVISTPVLAYLGDAVYEVMIRKELIDSMNVDINEMNKEKIKYVSAKNQSIILDKIIEKDLLTNEEVTLVRRAKNHKIKSKPRYTSVVVYKKATALEALFGMLYLKNDYDRIKLLIKEAIGE